MPEVLVVGGGPAGLSAALFTSKNGLHTVVYDTDKTWLHHAHLLNYLGVESRNGEVFLEGARQQTESFGADLREAEVMTVESTADGFTATTEEGEVTATYLVLATGSNRDLAEDLGCATTDKGIVDVTISMETSVEDAYATGAMVREEEWQAIISAGDGAAAALNILSKEKGEHYNDFDTPDEVE